MNGCAPGLALIERFKARKWAVFPTLLRSPRIQLVPRSFPEWKPEDAEMRLHSSAGH